MKCEDIVVYCKSSLICEDIVVYCKSSLICEDIVVYCKTSLICEDIVVYCKSSLKCEDIVVYCKTSLNEGLLTGLMMEERNGALIMLNQAHGLQKKRGQAECEVQWQCMH